MRKLQSRIVRKALGGAAIAAIMTGSAFLTGGTASASTQLAPNCTGGVTGSPGDAVAINSTPLAEIVRSAAKQKVFVLNGVDPDKLATAVNNGGPVEAGAVPGSGTTQFSGAQVAELVGARIKGNPALGWWPATNPTENLNFIKNKLAGTCGLTIQSNWVPPTTSSQQPAGGHPGRPGTAAPGTGGSLPGSGAGGIAPPRDYSNIPAATPGAALPPGARYPTGAPIPGQQSPEFGILGQDGNAAPGQADVRNAGQADALAADSSRDTVQLPMLLAVVALAGVTAALVRTWVLRRA
ncbi:hypothetical protein [Amycolatopsis anabasis]|uniref:hypothetical protein n=1 Tax=Amycolatopsis anabasis TaxID=1840409 RepID=UPI00131DCA5D|nr:hypothetical protein [Amycolatopsis anabasis]